MAEQVAKRVGERGGRDPVEAAMTGEERGQPFVEAGEKRGVVEPDVGEGAATTQLDGGGGPGQEMETVRADAFQQRGGDCLRVGVRVGAARQAQGAQAAFAEIIEAALAAGGTVTGEHGVGLHKRSGLLAELEPAVIAMHLALRQALDPAGILNPGKVVAGPSQET